MQKVATVMRNNLVIPLFYLLSIRYFGLGVAGAAVDLPSHDHTDVLAYRPCNQDPAKYSLRACELQRIKDADQADRPNNILCPGAVFRDRIRRKRVGEIFGEGCFKESADYAAAALVFQHGDHPDHFFQVFLWSKNEI